MFSNIFFLNFITNYKLTLSSPIDTVIMAISRWIAANRIRSFVKVVAKSRIDQSKTKLFRFSNWLSMCDSYLHLCIKCFEFSKWIVFIWCSMNIVHIWSDLPFSSIKTILQIKKLSTIIWKTHLHQIKAVPLTNKIIFSLSSICQSNLFCKNFNIDFIEITWIRIQIRSL